MISTRRARAGAARGLKNPRARCAGTREIASCSSRAPGGELSGNVTDEYISFAATYCAGRFQRPRRLLLE
jgi:hypothetical protein